jgi:aldose 1-epimerase
MDPMAEHSMAGQTLPLTGTQYEIAAGDYRASITELGAGLRSLTAGGRPVLTGYQPDDLPPAGAGQLLLPWPNRVDHGRYDFGGHRYQLDLSEPAHDNAIHGLTRWLTWQPAGHGADFVELNLELLGRPGYPFRLDLSARYQLRAETGLEVTVGARNSGSRPAPFGTGSHPYLRAGSDLVDGWRLQLPAAQWQPADARGIPAGPPQDVSGSPYDFRAARPIGSTTLDHAFTGLDTGQDGRAVARLTGPDADLALWAGPGYQWLQVFTGDPLGPDSRRRALAIEPMTCPPNAFVTGIDLRTIAPAEVVSYSWGIQAIS